MTNLKRIVLLGRASTWSGRVRISKNASFVSPRLRRLTWSDLSQSCPGPWKWSPPSGGRNLTTTTPVTSSSQSDRTWLSRASEMSSQSASTRPTPGMVTRKKIVDLLFRVLLSLHFLFQPSNNLPRGIVNCKKVCSKITVQCLYHTWPATEWPSRRKTTQSLINASRSCGCSIGKSGAKTGSSSPPTGSYTTYSLKKLWVRISRGNYLHFLI